MNIYTYTYTYMYIYIYTHTHTHHTRAHTGDGRAGIWHSPLRQRQQQLVRSAAHALNAPAQSLGTRKHPLALPGGAFARRERGQ